VSVSTAPGLAPLAGPASLPLDSLASVGAALASRPYARRGVAVSAERIPVLLVDDHAILRDGLKALLRLTPDIVVVGEAANGVDAVAAVSRLAPQVVVMDLDMPDGDGATATRALARLNPAPRVLILTMHQEEERLIPLLAAGASGYLSKEVADRELADAIRAVAAGEVYVRPRVARLLAADLRPRARPTPADQVREQFDALSNREQAVLRLIAQGYSGPEIGSQLGISAKTVDTYKQRIEDKLGLGHRTDYVRFALDAGLLAHEVPGGTSVAAHRQYE
jgi:two-component system, NarL family, response regulator NreC